MRGGICSKYSAGLRCPFSPVELVQDVPSSKGGPKWGLPAVQGCVGWSKIPESGRLALCRGLWQGLEYGSWLVQAG